MTSVFPVETIVRLAKEATKKAAAEAKLLREETAVLKQVTAEAVQELSQALNDVDASIAEYQNEKTHRRLAS